MKINMNEIWNEEFLTYEGKYGEEPKLVSKQKFFQHTINWYDAKTTTVSKAIDFSKSENAENSRDYVQLMLLILHKGEEEEVLEFSEGIYTEIDYIPQPILQFKYSHKINQYAFCEPEGEIIAFSLIYDLPLMMKFNETE